MTIRTVAWWAALALCTTSPRVRAQQPTLQPAPTAAYAVSGVVVDHDGNPLSGTDVAFIERDSVRRSVRSDVDGRFQLDGLPTATPTLRLRRLGYEPKMVSVQVPKTDRLARVVLTLDPSVARLDPVLVDDSGASAPDARLVGFYERVRKNAFGHYVTEAMLAQRRPHYASEALQGIAGVTIRPSRIGNIVRLRGCGSASSSPERFGPVVWVDGVRAKGAELDEITQGEDIAGIEVYNSMAGIPVQFFDRTAVCGTILVWTKSR